MTARVRQAAVAGQFYPESEVELRQTVEKLLPETKARPAVGVMAPHAGFVYSGALAGEVFASVEIPDTVVILCPNHTGRGARVSIAAADAFEIPGAVIPIQRALATAIATGFPGAQEELDAHVLEHAIEVELPFLVARNPSVQIVPIVVGPLSRDEAIELGRHLHRVLTDTGIQALVVASSDMSHYLPDAQCRTADERALVPLLAFKPEDLYDTVRDNDITMCGVIPATVMLSYAREQGAKGPELIGYATSGDAFGDRSRVVGYAGVVVR